MTDDLIERLRNLRVILKSGDYNGADLMKAWCAMADAADRLEAIVNKLQRMEEALRWLYRNGLQNDRLRPKFINELLSDAFEVERAALKD